MQDRHYNKKKYFSEQSYTSNKYVIPFIEKHKKITPDLSVLEIGCGEGGNLMPFLDRGCKCVGIDLSQGKIELGNEFYAEHPNVKNLELINEDTYNIPYDNAPKFDIIIMRDVLEHIHHQDKFMADVKKFITPDTLFYLGFPPWQNPFGGHQQKCKNKILSILPYYHILPKGIYKSILKITETDEKVENLLEIKQTQITIETFRKILKKEQYETLEEVFYFINPNYEIKFNLKPRKQWAIINKIPYLRNYFITTCYYLVRHKK